MRLAVDTMASSEPRTAARSHPARPLRCASPCGGILGCLTGGAAPSPPAWRRASPGSFATWSRGRRSSGGSFPSRAACPGGPTARPDRGPSDRGIRPRRRGDRPSRRCSREPLPRRTGASGRRRGSRSRLEGRSSWWSLGKGLARCAPGPQGVKKVVLAPGEGSMPRTSAVPWSWASFAPFPRDLASNVARSRATLWHRCSRAPGARGRCWGRCARVARGATGHRRRDRRSCADGSTPRSLRILR